MERIFPKAGGDFPYNVIKGWFYGVNSFRLKNTNIF